MIKVKTLTGKEIEVDIDGTDKIERIKERVEEKEGNRFPFLHSLEHLSFCRNSSAPTTADIRWETDDGR